MDYFAHSLEGKPPEEWQQVEEHLKGTAELAARFAAEFGAGEWGYQAGLWHDMWKSVEKGYSKRNTKKFEYFDKGGISGI